MKHKKVKSLTLYIVNNAGSVKKRYTGVNEYHLY